MRPPMPVPTIIEASSPLSANNRRTTGDISGLLGKARPGIESARVCAVGAVCAGGAGRLEVGDAGASALSAVCAKVVSAAVADPGRGAGSGPGSDTTCPAGSGADANPP